MSTSSLKDQWARWLLETRHGGDDQNRRDGLELLQELRDRLLARLDLKNGQTVLDVGAGDGLMAFGALEAVSPDGRVIFSDISTDLLAHSEQLARAQNVAERCSFVAADAANLSPIADASVDAITVRSVLVYVHDLAAAFREFYRVLRPGGRVAVFEPIAHHPICMEPETRLMGLDVAPILPIMRRVRMYMGSLMPPHDPMFRINEMALMAVAEQAGFSEMHAEVQLDVQPATWPPSWDVWIDSAPNPRLPPLREVMETVLTSEERAQFEACVRPQIGGHRLDRRAGVQLWARK